MDHEARLRKWHDSLPAGKKELFRTSGGGPFILGDTSIGGMRELDESTLDSDQPHSEAARINEAIIKASSMPAEFVEDPEAGKMIKLLHFFCDVLDAAHPKDSAALHAEVVRIVLGIGQPMAQRELAKKLGVPKTTVNKRVKRLQKLLELDPSHFMHHEGHCRSFSKGHSKKDRPGKDQLPHDPAG